MNIEAKDFEIKMSYGELWTIAFDMQNSLKNTLQTHWVNHQSNWKENEKERLRIIRAMFYALGRPELHESIFATADDIFKTFNDKKAKK